MYHKPTKAEGGYHPKRSYANQWYFQDLSTNTCEQIKNIGLQYYEKRKKGGLKGHWNRYYTRLVKAFYFNYLTGGRLNEVFLQPYPKIQYMPVDEHGVVVITKVNEKHKDSAGRRSLNDLVLPIMCEHEQFMWQFITDAGMTFKAQDIFAYDQWAAKKKGSLSGLFKASFTTNLIDRDGNVHARAGITPHILRHMRAYNWKFQHNVRDDLIVRWMGWKDATMLYEYVHIRTMMNLENQLKIIKQDGLLKPFPVHVVDPDPR